MPMNSSIAPVGEIQGKNVPRPPRFDQRFTAEVRAPDKMVVVFDADDRPAPDYGRLLRGSFRQVPWISSAVRTRLRFCSERHIVPAPGNWPALTGSEITDMGGDTMGRNLAAFPPSTSIWVSAQ